MTESFHLTISRRPYCEHLGCMAGRELAAASGVEQCAYETRAEAEASCLRVQANTKAAVAVVEGECPANANPPAAWVAGWNQPGYMPENPPEPYDSWHAARDSLCWEIERWDGPNAEASKAEFAAFEAEASAAKAELQRAAPGQPVEVKAGGTVWFIAVDPQPETVDAATPGIDTPTRYLEVTSRTGHLGREIEGEERLGFESFFAPESSTAAWHGAYRDGSSRGFAVAYAQGALAHAGDAGADAQSENPYPADSAAWSAWSEGYDDDAHGAL